jgi:hypothetical protein
MSLFKLALEEEDVSGNASHEIEYVIYGKIVSKEELLRAHSREHQAQWQMYVPHSPDNAGEGSMRIRKIIPNITDTNNVKYVYTVKLKPRDGVGKIEVPVEASEDMFKAFEILGDTGLIKDRHVFKVPESELQFEVDMFYLPGAEVGSGQYNEWVKIDLEMPNAEMALPELPIKLTDVIICKPGVSLTPEAQAIVDDLFENHFKTKNKFLNPPIVE